MFCAKFDVKECVASNLTLAFEYCKNIDAHVIGEISSVKNPASDKIRADKISEIILEAYNIDQNKTEIKC